MDHTLLVIIATITPCGLPRRQFVTTKGDGFRR